MDIDVEINDQHVRLNLRGRMTRADGGHVKKTIATLLQEGHRTFVLDFRDVTDIDSAGLADVVMASSAVYRHNGQIRIENQPDRPPDLLSMTKRPPDKS